MLARDYLTGELVDGGGVVVEREVTAGWGSRHPVQAGLPACLEEYRGVVPRVVLADAGRVIRALGLRTRVECTASLLYALRLHGYSIPPAVKEKILEGKRGVYRALARITRILGAVDYSWDGEAEALAGFSLALGVPPAKSIPLFRALRRMLQGYSTRTLMAASLVLAGAPPSNVVRLLGVTASGLSKALARAGELGVKA